LIERGEEPATSMVEELDGVIDKEGLFARAGKDWGSVEIIAKTYFEHSEHQLSQLTTAIKYKNIEDIHLLAHSIKGSLATLGSVAASATALKLEKAGSLGDLNKVDSLFDVLCQEISEYNKALTKFIEEKQL